MCSLGIEPTTFALLTQGSTAEPQELLSSTNVFRLLQLHTHPEEQDGMYLFVSAVNYGVPV